MWILWSDRKYWTCFYVMWESSTVLEWFKKLVTKSGISTLQNRTKNYVGDPEKERLFNLCLLISKQLIYQNKVKRSLFYCPFWNTNWDRKRGWRNICYSKWQSWYVWIQMGKIYNTTPSIALQVQCRHLISALNAWAVRAEFTSTCPIAAQFPGHGCMVNLTNECSFDSQGTRVIDVLGLFFWHVIHGRLQNQVLADVRATGAGIECLYCR